MTVPLPDEVKQTWAAFAPDNINADTLDTEIVREGWAYPTLYREHEVIHLLCNVIDKTRESNNRYREILLTLGFCPEDGESMPCTICGAGL